MTKQRMDLLQNLAIAVLTVSAAVLMTLLQTGRQSGTFASSPAVSGSGDAAESLSSLESVVRVAVSGPYGRYGEPHMTSTGDAFAPFGNLLQEALGSAGTLTVSSEEDFRAALEGTSLYCDWTAPLPMSVAAGLVGADIADDVTLVRRMALSAGSGAVTLWLTDDESWLRCSTKVSADALRSAISNAQLSSVAFAWELNETGTAPYTLLLTGDLPQPAPLDSESGVQPKDPLLDALGFNPNTNSRYTESNGTEVVRDGERILRIQTDSTLIYDSGGDAAARLQFSAGGEGTVTAAEAVLGSYRILSSLVSGSSAVLYPRSVEPSDGGWLVTFDYQMDGIPLRLSSGEPAARAEITGRGISAFTLALRRYNPASLTGTVLLPLRQALAVAAAGNDGELSLCYVDNGASAAAVWLKE